MRTVTNIAGVQIVRYHDVVPQAWANGGGVTSVVALGHVERSTAAFDWRLSIASVTSGPFSKLIGVERIITLVDGSGLALTIDEPTFSLEPFRPHRFAGEATTVCRTDQQTLVFNVMTRRLVCSASVSIRVGSGHLAAPVGCPTYVLPLRGTACVRPSGGHEVTLQRFDTMRLSAASELCVHSGGRTAVVRVRPRHGLLPVS